MTVSSIGYATVIDGPSGWSAWDPAFRRSSKPRPIIQPARSLGRGQAGLVEVRP